METTSKPMLWGGRILSGLFVLFMLMDVTIKLAKVKQVDETMTQMGIPTDLARPIGVIEAICLVLYVIPRTSVLGAVLLTAVMGGAIASHWRIDSPLFSHTLFGVYLGLMLWGGLWLRDARLRAVMPLRR